MRNSSPTTRNDIPDRPDVAAHLAAIVESSDDAIVSKTLQGIVLTWNAGAERIFGYSAEEMVGRSIRTVIPRNRQAEEDDVLARLVRGERIDHFETVRLRKDGREILVSLTISPVLDQDGQVVAASKIARDITAERAIERQALHFAALVESSDDAIISKDLNGTVLSWNPAATRIFGYEPEEMIGRSIRTLIPDDRQSEEDEVLAKIRRGEKVDHFETVRRHKDGSSVAISLTVSPIFDTSGRVIAASKIARDITEQKRRQAEFSRLESERFAIVEAITDPVITVDRGGHIYDANPAAEVAFGFSRELAIGRDLSEFLAGSTFDRLRAELIGDAEGADQIESRRVQNLIARRADGSEFPVEVTITAVPHIEQERYTLLLRDISVRVAQERAMQEAAELKDQFLGMVSHELRTPIAIVTGNGQLLQRRGKELPEEEQKASLDDLVANAERLQAIIENLLLLTRTEQRGSASLEPVRLAPLVRQAANDFSQRNPSRQIDVTTIDPVPLVQGEPTLLSLIVENLLSNATKYSPATEPIELRLSTSEEGDALLEVLDRGIGISPEDAEAVFMPFVRTKSAERRARGMGLGLAVCKRIVEAHGGTLGVQPRDGGGSRFWVILPSAELL